MLYIQIVNRDSLMEALDQEFILKLGVEQQGSPRNSSSEAIKAEMNQWFASRRLFLTVLMQILQITMHIGNVGKIYISPYLPGYDACSKWVLSSASAKGISSAAKWIVCEKCSFLRSKVLEILIISKSALG